MRRRAGNSGPQGSAVDRLLASERGTKRQRAVERALKILEVIGSAEGGLGVSDLARALDADKGNVHRMLGSLSAAGYIQQDPETRRYLLAPKIIRLGNMAANQIDWRDLAVAGLKRLTAETGESSHLAILSEGDVVYVASQMGESLLAVNIRVGIRTPPHCTAVGKVLLAALSSEELELLIARIKFERFTARTIVSPELFQLHLQEVRAQGYALDDEEFAPGVRCIAAPVYNQAGYVLAAMSISGPSVRMTLDAIPQLIPRVLAVSRDVSEKLGYRLPARAGASHPAQIRS
jgi:DNA-binding IclR family transcriptional regulator